MSALVRIGAVALGTGLAAGAAAMGYRHLYGRATGDAAPPEASAPARSSTATPEFNTLQSILTSNLAAVVTDADGHVHVQSLRDRLLALHQLHGDTAPFVAAARALLLEHGLLQQLDHLVSSSMRATGSAAAHTVPEKTHSRLARSANPPSAASAVELAILDDLILSDTGSTYQDEHQYFSAWRDRLPPGEAFAWLRNAPEDRQIAYKKLLDHAATNEKELLTAFQDIVAEQPGAVELSRRLHRQHLPKRPEEILLKAILPEKVGSLSGPVSVSMRLDEAWQAGMLDRMLMSDQLSVDVLSQRRVLKGKALAAFKNGLRSIPAPPQVEMVNNDDRARLAFRHLTEARFELSTLEAELKGELSTTDHIRGLHIVENFRNGTAGIQAGHLTFSARDVAGRPFNSSLSGWLVLRDSADNFVLYDADASGRSHYFSSMQAMTQFASETAMRNSVSMGRLEVAAMAEGRNEARRLSEFFQDFRTDAGIWRSRDAVLNFVPASGETYSTSMSAFAGRLQSRNTALLKYDAATRDAAARVVSLGANWSRVKDQYGMPTLLEHTRAWMMNRSDYGEFLQLKGAINQAKDFDPDAIFIRSPSGESFGTLTEFAAYLRRRESSRADFAANMELMPAAVVDDAHVSALTPRGRVHFANTLSRAINSPSGAAPSTPDERYVATLRPEALRDLNAAMQLHAKLNRLDIKEGIDSALRAGYPGDDFQRDLRAKKDFTQPQNRMLRDAWNMLEVSKMQLALAMAKQNGIQEMGTAIPGVDAERIERLLQSFPGSARSRHDFMAPLTVGGVRVAGMVMFALRDGQRLANGARVRPRQYVYSPDPVHGDHVFTAQDFSALLKRSEKARDVVAARVSLGDINRLRNKFDEAKAHGSSPGVPVGYQPVNRYDLYSEMLDKRIADADERTVSQWEVRRDAAMSGIGAMTLPVCLAAGPAAAASCAALTLVSLVNDGYEAAQLWSRNQRGMALLTGMLGTLDVADVGHGARVAGRALGLGRGLTYMARRAPAVMMGNAGGVQEALSRLGLKHFNSLAEASTSATDTDRYRGAFDNGWLRRDWAVNVDLGTARRVTAQGAPAGDFFELGGKTYIRERGYPGERALVYEVIIGNGGPVRVINPHHPDVPDNRLRWNGIKWVNDSRGLLGGSRYSDTELQGQLQKMKKVFEREAANELACDTKSQRVLKVMQRNKELWAGLEDKVEVRVIKLKEGDSTGEIVLHPKDEDEPRWSGQYHIYVTVNLNNERLVVDPYVGGPDSCAKVTEKEFIAHHWEGDEGKDYEIKNLAPFEETVEGGDPNDIEDLVTYSVEDFIDNQNIYDPDYYPSHRFYYRT